MNEIDRRNIILYRFSDESASDLICQDDLNETDVSEDLKLYFSNMADADTSLKVLCCINGNFFYVFYPNKVLACQYLPQPRAKQNNPRVILLLVRRRKTTSHHYPLPLPLTPTKLITSKAAKEAASQCTHN